MHRWPGYEGEGSIGDEHRACDAQPPVVRATVMVLVGCAALTLGRRALGYNSIAAAGLIVLAMNPAELFQPGTQLSFLCVTALAWLSDARARAGAVDPLARLIAATRPWHVRAARGVAGQLWRATVAGAVIWLLVTPLVMARFHLVSPVAVVLGPVLSIPVGLCGLCFGIVALVAALLGVGPLRWSLAGIALCVLAVSMEFAIQQAPAGLLLENNARLWRRPPATNFVAPPARFLE